MSCKIINNWKKLECHLFYEVECPRCHEQFSMVRRPNVEKHVRYCPSCARDNFDIIVIPQKEKN